MKTKLLLIFFLIIPTFTFAEQTASNSGTNIEKIKIENTNFNKDFNDYKMQISSENKQYKEGLESSYSKYVSVIQEMKSDLLWFLGLCSSLLLIAWGILWYFIQKITKKQVDEKTEEIIRPEWDRKTKELSNELDEFFQERKDGVRRKDLLYIIFGTNDDSHFLRQQGFANISIKQFSDIDIENDYHQKDLIILDVIGIQLINGNNTSISNIIESIRNINQHIPVILYIKGIWGGPETNFFLMTNGKIRLLSAIIECLNLNTNPDVLVPVTTTN